MYGLALIARVFVAVKADSLEEAVLRAAKRVFRGYALDVKGVRLVGGEARIQLSFTIPVVHGRGRVEAVARLRERDGFYAGVVEIYA